MSDLILGSFLKELEKIADVVALRPRPLWTKVAAPRQVKELRKLVRSGDLRGAQRLAKSLQDAGVLKVTPQGTQLKHLGSGSEGVGTLVAGAADAPAGELAVRKAYDRGSALFDRRNLAEKHNIMRRAKDHPNFARTYSSKIRKGKGGTPYTIGEFVQGRKDVSSQAGGLIGRVGGKGSTGFSRAANLLPGAEFGVGAKKTLGDVIGFPGNTIITPSGVPKIIDMLPGTHKGVQGYMSGSTPRMRATQRLIGLSELGTAPSVTAAERRSGEALRKLQANPDMMRKAVALSGRNLPAEYEGIFGIRGVSPSDVGPRGLRKANVRRTLSGL